MSDNGGELDLDSNAACDIDGVNNENITYPDGSPPRCQYTVRVNYYDECNVSQTNHVVTVRVQGQRRAPSVVASLAAATRAVPRPAP